MSLVGYDVIYGGSFNPPHIGHQIACMWILETLGADKVWVVPTYQHAFGKQLTDFYRRVAMCDLISRPFNNRMQVSAVEETLPHPNITLNTVKWFKENVKSKIAVAIGSDLVPELDTWTGWDEVIKLAKVIVVGRTGTTRVDHNYPIYDYPVELSAISSSVVRSQIRRGESIEGMVPCSVVEYIKAHGLYK